MTARLIDNLLILNNPAVAPMPGEPDFYADLGYLGSLDRDYPLSFEMMEFLVKYDKGGHSDPEIHQRCFKIGTRKGCYGAKLISDFGFLTDAGKIALNNAKILDARMKRYYERARKTWLNRDTATSLDEIIPYGTIPGYAVRMLTYLWEADIEDDPDKLRLTVRMPHTWSVKQSRIDGETYLLMGSIRNNMYARQAADIAIRYGLVDLRNLPKSPLERGIRGRSPVGIKLSEMGRRFYSSYLSLFDPQQQFERRLAAEREAAMRDNTPVYYKPPTNRAEPTNQAQPSNDLPPEEREDKYGRFDGIDLDSFAELNKKLNQNLKTSDLYDPTAPITESNDETPDRTELIQDQTDSFHNVDQPVFREVETPTRSTKKATMSDSSDIVDGENLRDLFG